MKKKQPTDRQFSESHYFWSLFDVIVVLVEIVILLKES
jgi:hypothetical protein